jgi:hypothetical protein
MSKPEEIKPKLYLIGLSHGAQMKDKGAPENETQKEFRDCLESALGTLRPSLVAEELSEYALQRVAEEKQFEQESLTKLIADSAGVEHRFCDPNDDERNEIGYIEGSAMVLKLMLGDERLSDEEINLRAFGTEIHKHWPAREGFWLDRLGEVKDRVVVFVCGDGHIDSFKSLFTKRGIESVVIKRAIGLTNHDVEFSKKVHLYIKGHPEIFI